MRNILVTGANGQLGKCIEDLSNLYSYNFFFVSKNELDICNKNEINLFIEKNNINYIINCAAYTAVDLAEDEYEKADNINHIAVGYLAEISKNKNISLIHISTDYVFNGKNFKPYEEKDKTMPLNNYGITKLNGEILLQEINPKNSIILRTSWVYSEHGNNFVKTILRLAHEREKLSIIYDQIGTPTYAKDLAKAILDIIPKLDNNDVEIFHFSNEGVASWYDFSKEIIKNTDIKCQLSPIESEKYHTKAMRPYYSLLNKAKFKNRFDYIIPHWKDSLNICMARLGY